MRKNLAVAFASLVVASLAPIAHAAPIRLGAPLDAVRASLVNAKQIQREANQQSLELTNVSYSGMAWDKVDYNFDPNGRLVSVSMQTHAASYDRILTMAADVDTSDGGLKTETGTTSVDNHMQIRVCESDDGGVTMTYEGVAASI